MARRNSNGTPVLGSGRALDTLKKLGELEPVTRGQLLALCGVTPEVLAGYVRESLAVAGAAMKAMKVQRLVVPGAKGEGASVEVFEDIDHTTRLQGADLVNKVVGLYAPRQAAAVDPNAPGQVVNVNVTLRDMSPQARAMPPVVARSL